MKRRLYLLTALTLMMAPYTTMAVESQKSVCARQLLKIVKSLEILRGLFPEDSVQAKQITSLLVGTGVLGELFAPPPPLVQQVILAHDPKFEFPTSPNAENLTEFYMGLVGSHLAKKSAIDLGATKRRNLPLSPVDFARIRHAEQTTGKGASILVTEAIRVGLALVAQDEKGGTDQLSATDRSKPPCGIKPVIEVSIPAFLLAQVNEHNKKFGQANIFIRRCVRFALDLIETRYPFDNEE